MSSVSSKKSKPSAIAKKSAARLAAVQLVYEQEMRPCALSDLLTDYKNNRLKLPLDAGEELVTADLSFLNRIVNGVDEKKAIFEAGIMTNKYFSMNRSFMCFQIFPHSNFCGKSMSG